MKTMWILRDVLAEILGERLRVQIILYFGLDDWRKYWKKD
jgi:hypothetical protein